MLDELGPALTRDKAKDVLARLSRKRQPDQVIAGEMELGLLWAMKQVGHLEIEPEGVDGRVPDSYSADLFEIMPALIEITTVSDAHFSGEKVMRRAVSKIGEFANTVRRGSARELSIRFGERSAWIGGRYHYERRITGAFELDEKMRQALRAWLLGSKIRALRIEGTDIDVAISWQAGRKVRTANYWPMSAPLAYDIEANPIYRALTSRRKRKQLRHSNDVLRCIFLADGGCDLLRNFDRIDPLRRAFSGRSIVRHAMQHAKLDVVCVFAPKRQADLRSPSMRGPLGWTVEVVVAPEFGECVDVTKIEALALVLPRPRFEGYQARSLQQRGMFIPKSRGWHLGTTVMSRRDGDNSKMSIKVSARAVQELLAGRLSHDHFSHPGAGSDKNIFDHFLKSGLTISSVRLEPGGIDDDDDCLIFEFAQDPAASEFQAKANTEIV